MADGVNIWHRLPWNTQLTTAQCTPGTHQEAKALLRSLKRGPIGRTCTTLGKDGVLRSYDTKTYEIIDARGLNPKEIKHILDFLPDGDAKKEVEKDLKGVDGSKLTSYEALFKPAPDIRPRAPTEAEILKARRYMETMREARAKAKGSQ